MNDSTSQNRIVDVAQSMLTGSKHYLEGCVELVRLRDEIGAYENDPAFIGFIAVLCHLAELPFDTSQADWSRAVAAKHQHELENSVAWAKEITEGCCEALIARYKTNTP